MYKIVLLLVVSIFLVSCSQTSPAPLKSNQKAFENEDTYILFALRAEEIKDYESAVKLYQELYKRSQKKEYLYRYLKNNILLKNNQLVVNVVDKEIKQHGFDPILERIKVVALLGDLKLAEARDTSIALAKKTDDVDDYILVSEIYVALKEYDLALKYLEGAYAKDYNEKILDRMSVVMYVNLGRKKDAIAELETYTRMMGCSEVICKRLIGFYSDENNIDGILSTYLRLYEIDKKPEIAKKIVQIYNYKQEYLKLMDFLERTGADDETLLQLYSTSKNYKKASVLADKLYHKNYDVDFLAQSAIYEYESQDKGVSKEVLSDVISKLEDVVKKHRKPLYLNYLGYILIDHEVDVKRGMGYIKEVIKKQPDSVYYLDSLAWGYYKLKKCKQAKKVMDKIVKLGGDKEKEVQEHIEAIDRCLKKKKR